MNAHTHSLAEWAAVLSLGVSVWSVMAAVIWLTADAELEDFDPRPAARRTAGALHQGAVHAGHDLNRAIATSQRHAAQAAREAALTAAALLALLLPATGSTR
ncbi:hypothetical protein [Streptomyces sp. NBC_01614]|uniref:hypothetical protein n=1 Tax=Streptomyces sp. NBC_01614 TaxID=2975897 RepID=UPI0038704D82